MTVGELQVYLCKLRLEQKLEMFSDVLNQKVYVELPNLGAARVVDSLVQDFDTKFAKQVGIRL